MTLAQIDAEMAAQQKRLTAPEVLEMTKRQIDALRKSVDEHMVQLQTMRRRELEAREKATGKR